MKKPLTPKPQDTGWQAPLVESSHIKYTRWQTGNILSVEFGTGAKFQYQNVTKEQYKDLRASPSAGKWFHVNIKTQEEAHPFTQI